jgi:hypothetical protein
LAGGNVYLDVVVSWRKGRRTEEEERGRDRHHMEMGKEGKRL